MNGSLPTWAGGSPDQFTRTLEAFARYNSRPRITPAEAERQRIEAHKRDPRHVAALTRRRKRKRGGPK